MPLIHLQCLNPHTWLLFLMVERKLYKYEKTIFLGRCDHRSSRFSE